MLVDCISELLESQLIDQAKINGASDDIEERQDPVVLLYADVTLLTLGDIERRAVSCGHLKAGDTRLCFHHGAQKFVGICHLVSGLNGTVHNCDASEVDSKLKGPLQMLVHDFAVRILVAKWSGSG